MSVLKNHSRIHSAVSGQETSQKKNKHPIAVDKKQVERIREKFSEHISFDASRMKIGEKAPVTSLPTKTNGPNVHKHRRDKQYHFRC